MSESIGIRGIDHIELWVGNAKQAAGYYRAVFGFELRAYAGLETGLRDRASYLMEQGEIRLLLTSPLGAEGPIAEHLRRHGDGVRDVAFEVEDADRAFELAISRGAFVEEAPEGDGVRRAAIRAYGETIHSLIARRDLRGGGFLPGFVERSGAGRAGSGLRRIDHVVANVEPGKMQVWADWYARVFDFEPYLSFDDKDISTEYSALRSVVMADAERRIKLPINEPAAGRGGRKSQIQEYLDYYGSPGVQHIALHCDEIVSTVGTLRESGVEFLEVPAAYYRALPDRVGTIEEPFEELQRLGVLVDRDDQGYLLQLFTKPVQDRPTLFLEVIQRRGARGFGKGNFKALFEAIEREQQRRGNL